MKLCLDTSAYSNFKRGHAPAVEAISRASWVGVPAIVIGELRVGFARGSRRQLNEGELATFLAHPLVTSLEIDDEAARIYAEVVCALREAGTPVPTNDIWIAAVAAREGASVLTYDAHFSQIHRVGSTLLQPT
jgi:tRNA(fMet)-specific endonuclease VapC